MADVLYCKWQYLTKIFNKTIQLYSYNKHYCSLDCLNHCNVLHDIFGLSEFESFLWLGILGQGHFGMVWDRSILNAVARLFTCFWCSDHRSSTLLPVFTGCWHHSASSLNWRSLSTGLSTALNLSICLICSATSLIYRREVNFGHLLPDFYTVSQKKVTTFKLSETVKP